MKLGTLSGRSQDYDFLTLSYILRDTEFGKRGFHETYQRGLEYAKKVYDYLGNRYESPLFIFGSKGCGKTFSAMAALGTKVAIDKDFLPAMMVYDIASGPRPLHLTQIGSQQDVGEREEKLAKMGTPERMMDAADAIVYDDVHYRCQAAMAGGRASGEGAKKLVCDLKSLLTYSSEGKKVVLISEDPLSLYAEKMRDDDLTSLLPQFGDTPYWSFSKGSGQWAAIKRDQRHMSLVEFSDPSFETWRQIVKEYGVRTDRTVDSALYQISRRPRSFVKTIGLLPELDNIRWEDLAARTRSYAKEKGRPLTTFQELALSMPFIRTDMRMQTFKERMSKHGDFYIKNEPPAEENLDLHLGSMVSNIRAMSFEYDLARNAGIEQYKIERLLSMAPDRENPKADMLVAYYGLTAPSELRMMIGRYKAVGDAARGCADFRIALHNIRRGIPGARKVQVSVLAKNINRYYTEYKSELGDIMGWLATEPIKAGIGDVIVEEPTLEILRRMNEALRKSDTSSEP
jgi:hypothetical protein